MSKEQKPTPSADKITTEQKAEALRHYRLGRTLWQQGRRGEAMTEYNRAVALDPESPAATALEMANTVMDFFDRSRYNP